MSKYPENKSAYQTPRKNKNIKFNYISHPTVHNLYTQVNSTMDPEKWPRATKEKRITSY